MTDTAAPPAALSTKVADDIRRSALAGRLVIAVAGLASTSWAYRNMVATAMEGGADPIFAWVAAGFLELGLLGSAFMARAAILANKSARFWTTLMWVLSSESGAFSMSHELGNPAWWMPALTAGLPIAAAALWHGLLIGEHRMNAGPDVAERAREQLTLRYTRAQDALRDTVRDAAAHRAQGHRVREWWCARQVRKLERAEVRAYERGVAAHRNREEFDERVLAWLEADERNDTYRARRFLIGVLPPTEPAHTAHGPQASAHSDAHADPSARTAHVSAHAQAQAAHDVHTHADAQPSAHHGERALRTAQNNAQRSRARAAQSRSVLRGRELTPTEVLTVDAMRAAREPWTAVAQELGMTRDTVKRAYARATGAVTHTPAHGTPAVPTPATASDRELVYAGLAPDGAPTGS